MQNLYFIQGNEYLMLISVGFFVSVDIATPMQSFSKIKFEFITSSYRIAVVKVRSK